MMEKIIKHKDQFKLVFQNSQILNLIRSINCTLESLVLMDDFWIVKSFKIFITILRKVNLDLGKVIHSQEEELEEKLYLKMKEPYITITKCLVMILINQFLQYRKSKMKNLEELRRKVKNQKSQEHLQEKKMKNNNNRKLYQKKKRIKNQNNYIQEENNSRLSIDNKDQANDFQQDLNQNPFTAKIIFHSFTPPCSQTNYDSKAEQYK